MTNRIKHKLEYGFTFTHSGFTEKHWGQSTQKTRQILVEYAAKLLVSICWTCIGSLGICILKLKLPHKFILEATEYTI